MIKFRKATIEDCKLYFDWANDELVRQQSFNSNEISYDSHVKWFTEKINNSAFLFLLFENEKNEKIGQIRFQNQEEKIAVIGISISKEQRGKGYASKILKIASDYYLENNNSYIIYAYIKKENTASIQSFAKAGFIFYKELVLNNANSFLYIKNK